MDIHLIGPFLAAKYAVPAIRRARREVIVMIASAAGASVSSSKGDVNGLGLTLEQSLAEENIRVNAPCPGNIATPLKLGIIYQQV
ncbi:MAG TPA: SDR family NAD(P)-dependent oxidoreductase [Dehalococcoidia bacterium]|nr:hypothetical protein [Dehalococcoidia bacterium]HIM18673.1 SDR family NAD(P)-dependent oxidoreductase [Dehalococcoidia bacterium]